MKDSAFPINILVTLSAPCLQWAKQRTHPRYKRESVGPFPPPTSHETRWWGFFSFSPTMPALCTTNESRRLVGGVSFRFHPRRRPFAPPTSHDDSLVGFLFISTMTPGFSTTNERRDICRVVYSLYLLFIM
jgi:hypothetical protein